MKSKQLFTFIVIALFLLSSCAKIYYSPDSKAVARNHSILAIMPPSVSIAAKRKVDAEAIKEQQKTESLNFQKEIYSWLLRRKMNGQFVSDFQEVDYTNAKLKKAGYPDEPMTTEEICSLLKVDGLVKSNFGLSKPMGDGAAIAAALILGGAGATNEVRINFSINDCKSKSLIFSYDHKFSGGLGSSPARLVDAMMRRISRKMPHYVNN